MKAETQGSVLDPDAVLSAKLKDTPEGREHAYISSIAELYETVREYSRFREEADVQRTSTHVSDLTKQYSTEALRKIILDAQPHDIGKNLYFYRTVLYAALKPFTSFTSSIHDITSAQEAVRRTTPLDTKVLSFSDAYNLLSGNYTSSPTTIEGQMETARNEDMQNLLMTLDQNMRGRIHSAPELLCAYATEYGKRIADIFGVQM